MDQFQDIGLCSTMIEGMTTASAPNPIFSSAVQITRPKSAATIGSSSLTNSPINQIKVAKLVLKPASMSISNKTINKPSSPLKNIDKFRTQSPNHPSVQQNRKVESGDHKLLMKKNQETVELEMKTLRTGREKKALNEPQQQKVSTVAESSGHKSTAIDEATRHEAREYMKKQREKRKLEVKKEVDKSFVIQQRLDELRKTTRNVISKKPKPKKNPIKVSPPLEYYSMNNRHMKEIKILKLKPMSAKKSPKVVEETKAKQLEISAEKTFEESSPEKPPSPVKKSSFFEKNLVKKVLEPKLLNQGKKILQLQNRVVHKKPEVFQHSRHSSKENQKPSEENLKLRVPDVKLSMSAINRTEIGQRNFLPTDQIPFWLQDTSIQPYPYNFIWAVRKKLEAYNSAEEAKQKSKVTTNFETPHARKPMRGKKSRRFPDFLSKHPGDDSKYDLQRPTIVEDSETNVTSLDNDIEANTISEISSIKSDMALVKSQSQEKQLKDEDDTTISESIFHSVKEDGFIGKKRESINSEFDRNSFDKKKSELKVSPNTSEKRENFLLIPKLSKQNDLDNNRINQEKEGEYQKMLQAFNQSLSHVIEVNQMLTTVLTSKSSSNGTAKNYTSSFENNIESEVQKSTDISEMIENLVLQSKPAVPSTVIESRSDSSSIATFIEDSQSKTLKPEIGKTIRDPPIMYNETAPELSSSTTKMTMSIVQQKIEGKAEGTDNTLNESNLLNILNQSEAENSFNVSFAENNASFGILMEKSSTEIKSWERQLIERTRGQIAWLELQKQSCRKHGQLEKVSTIKKQQRAVLLRLEKERLKLKENSTKQTEENLEKSIVVYEQSNDLSMNDSNARNHIERILVAREQKINKRRAQVEHLVKWQRKLDKEEEKLKQMEQELLGDIKKISSPGRKKKFDDILNSSIEMVKSIDKSLKILDTIEPSEGEEIVDVSGAKLNKLWYRLTGNKDKRYDPEAIYNLSKQDFAHFYEDAKEFVLQSDLKVLLETSMVKEEKKKGFLVAPQDIEQKEKLENPQVPDELFNLQPPQDLEEPQQKSRKISPQFSEDEISNVSTMNSIANIETEEEFPGSYPETFTPTLAASSTENDDDLQQMFANQMKVFIDQRLPKSVELARERVEESSKEFQESSKAIQESSKAIQESSKAVKTFQSIEESPEPAQKFPKLSQESPVILKNSPQITTPTIDNVTFQVRQEISEDLDSSDMDIEQDSLIQTEPLVSIDNSAVDEDGSIIPEINDLLITDMDDENENQDQLIEDISFPDFDISGNETNQHNDSSNRNDLSTITECTEYEQSQGSSSEEISSEIISTTTTSERANSEIEKRLISINDSMEEVNEAFKKAITNQSSSTVTYSTDKDFEDAPKASSSESQATSSTPKILMPEILSENSCEHKEKEKSSDF